MLLWSSRSTTLEVIKEEVGEMDRTNKDGKNMDENNSKGNDNEDNYTQNCKDEIDEGLDNTEEETDERNTHESKNEQSEKIENRNRTDHKNVALQKPTLCVTFSEGEDVNNSHQNESFDENSIGTGFSVEEEEDDGTRESLWKKWKKAFSWNDFFYAIIFGLGPTSWDVLSDLRFGWNLARSGDLSSAGLCYLFITIPGVFFLQEVILVHIFKDCSPKVNTIAYIASGFLGIGAMAFGFYAKPLLFQYPATILGFSIIGVKVVGVFVHTPEMKAFSVRISAFEYTTESNLQLLLLFYLWS